jgi:hypothetical protein
MEWLQQGTFTNQYRHPPLAGIVSALGPFIHGLRSPRRWKPAERGESVIFEEGNVILYSNNDYWRSLTLARIGTLPFFVLACAVTFLWSRCGILGCTSAGVHLADSRSRRSGDQ